MRVTSGAFLMLDDANAGTPAWDGLLDDADCFDFIGEQGGAAQAQTFTTTEIFTKDTPDPVAAPGIGADCDTLELSVTSVTGTAKFQPTTQSGLSTVLGQALSRRRTVAV